MNERLLVIMPVLNLWEQYSRQALESLHCSRLPWSVLLIDNASTDGTYDKAEALRKEWEPFPNRRVLKVLRNEVNQGVAGSWNQGVRYGLEWGYTHFLIVNNDVLLHKDAIDALVERMQKGGVALVAAVDISGESHVATEIFNMPAKAPSESPHPNFSCFMITKDTIEKVGYFDEGFYPGYFEDNDYHHRIKRILGEQAAITTTTAMLYHYGSRTQNQDISKPIVPGPQFEKNRAYYVKKWGGPPGQETFEHPFNDPSLPLTHVTLSSTHENTSN